MPGDDVEANQDGTDPFHRTVTGNDPFLTHAAGINRPPPGRQKRSQLAAQKSSWKEILITIALIIFPWLIFAGISCLFVFLYHRHYDVVRIVVFSCIVLSIMPMAMGGDRKAITSLMAGLLCLVAVIAGTVCGLYNYYEHMFAYWSFLDNGVYTNLLPSEPAAMHKDAGKIFFSDFARVDTTKSVGYKDGPVYCVAPITDEVPAPKMQYWAVGQNCCSQRADFNCDDAWSAKAHSGVVVLESNELIPSRRDQYMKAVKLAESTYDIVSAPDPILVRWVAEPEVVQDDYWRSGIGFLIASVCIYLPFSMLLGGIAHQSVKRATGRA